MQSYRNSFLAFIYGESNNYSGNLNIRLKVNKNKEYSRTQPHFRSRCRKNQLGENKPARKTVIHVFNFPDIYMFILYVLANSSLKVCSAYI